MVGASTQYHGQPKQDCQVCHEGLARHGMTGIIQNRDDDASAEWGSRGRRSTDALRGRTTDRHRYLAATARNHVASPGATLAGDGRQRLSAALCGRSEWYRNLVLVTRRNKYAMGAFVLCAGIVIPYGLTEGFMALTSSEERRKKLEEKLRKNARSDSEVLARVNKERLQVLLTETKLNNRDSTRYAESLKGKIKGETQGAQYGEASPRLFTASGKALEARDK
eukprot:scaffold1190_cov393-Prasinococcus_capsulatus_cf.AAC.24